MIADRDRRGERVTEGVGRRSREFASWDWSKCFNRLNSCNSSERAADLGRVWCRPRKCCSARWRCYHKELRRWHMRAGTYGAVGACGREGSSAQWQRHVHLVGDLCACAIRSGRSLVVDVVLRSFPGVYWCELFLERREKSKKKQNEVQLA